jgi:hypothetical protein
MISKEDARRFMKTLRELCFISDNLTDERTKSVAIAFQRYLKRIYEENKTNLFLYAWQWFLSIARANDSFRKIIKSHNHLFAILSNVSISYLYGKNNKHFDSPFKIYQNRHPLYGFMAPTSLK